MITSKNQTVWVLYRWPYFFCQPAIHIAKSSNLPKLRLVWLIDFVGLGALSDLSVKFWHCYLAIKKFLISPPRNISHSLHSAIIIFKLSILPNRLVYMPAQMSYYSMIILGKYPDSISNFFNLIAILFIY